MDYIVYFVHIFAIKNQKQIPFQIYLSLRHSDIDSTFESKRYKVHKSEICIVYLLKSDLFTKVSHWSNEYASRELFKMAKPPLLLKKLKLKV